jgi:hypothetical protein
VAVKINKGSSHLRVDIESGRKAAATGYEFPANYFENTARQI